MPQGPFYRQSPEYQKVLEERELYRLYKSDYPDMKWVGETLARLEKKEPYGDYTDKDYIDMKKAREILHRVTAKAAQSEADDTGPDLWHDDGDADDSGTDTPSNTAPPTPKFTTSNGTITPVSANDWNTFYQTLQNTAGLDPAEQYAYLQTFGAEGGMMEAPNGAVAGIKPSTLAGFLQDPSLSSVLNGVQTPSDLSTGQIPDLYQAYFDNAFSLIGGSAALGDVGNQYAAAALADTVFEHGVSGGSQIILDAVNNTFLDVGSATQISVTLAPDQNLTVGPRIFSAYSSFAQNPATLGTLLDNIAELRTDAIPSEAPRFNYFTFQGQRGSN